MGEVRLQWVSGKTFLGIDSTKHGFAISTSGEEDGAGAKPSDLLMLALASCSSVDVVEILHKKRQTFTRLEVRVEGQQEPDPPWTFRKVHLHYLFQGDALEAHAVEQAIQLSIEKYCSVAATIRGAAEITTSYEILPPPDRALG
jgi:putative redox protein